MATTASPLPLVLHRWPQWANLLLQVVDPRGQEVGEARRNTMALQATLNISLEATPAPAPKYKAPP